MGKGSRRVSFLGGSFIRGSTVCDSSHPLFHVIDHLAHMIVAST